MSDFPDLYALVMRLRTEHGGPPPAAAGNQVQALFLELVRQVDPELSNALHADTHSKPFTVAALPSTSPGRRAYDRTLDLRVALLRADLFAPFTHALLQQTSYPALRLGQTALALNDVCGTPGGHTWAGYRSYAELVAVSAPCPGVTLEFATPTVFSQATLGDGRKRLGLLPVPETVFGSIARRWNELAPASLRIDEQLVQAACADTLISRYVLETQQINLGKGPQKGFVGHCSYEFPADREQQRLLTLLADAAFYLGVGAKTARGMGLCRRLP